MKKTAKKACNVPELPISCVAEHPYVIDELTRFLMTSNKGTPCAIMEEVHVI